MLGVQSPKGPDDPGRRVEARLLLEASGEQPSLEEPALAEEKVPPSGEAVVHSLERLEHETVTRFLPAITADLTSARVRHADP
jgi:hypothetical protein